MNRSTDTLIIGAGIAGLACAAALHRRGVGYVILEKQDRVAAAWRNHYDRLHLHTDKTSSHLPFRKFRTTIPRYPSRAQLVDYLDAYRETFQIEPVFQTEVTKASRRDAHWIVETGRSAYGAAQLIVATGVYSKPRPIHFPGVDTFPGPLLHSSDYRTGKIFCGQNVLVVGFGNSACEIAIDLFEHGANPSMSVRSPVNIVPRDVFGVPLLTLSRLLSPLPPRVADLLSAPLMRMLTGNISRLGLRRKAYGPLQEISRDGHPPVLDIGTIRHIRKGHIGVHSGIAHIEDRAVHFADGTTQTFDAIVACIGFEPGYKDILDVDDERIRDARLPPRKQRYFGRDGLYLPGYWISPTGQIRAIRHDALRIARHIAINSSSSP